MSVRNYSTYESTAVAAMYGGGQIPSANFLMGSLIESLISFNCKVYGIHKSFMGLSDKSSYELMSLCRSKLIQTQMGTYFETCRNVDPSSDQYYYKILKVLKDLHIHTLFVCGGDGSLRASSAFNHRCAIDNFKIKIVFIPCTIDGISGSKSIGIDSAVSESIRRVQCMMVNSFATLDPKLKGSRVPIIQLQGRDRNDILFDVMKRLEDNSFVGKYNMSDIDIICIPTGYSWSFVKVINAILQSERNTAIIVSEGAIPTEKWWDAINGKGVGNKLSNLIDASNIRKSNFDSIGYLSQTNHLISDNEIAEIRDWTHMSTLFSITNDRSSIAIVKNSHDELLCEHLYSLLEKNCSTNRPFIGKNSSISKFLPK